MQRRIASFIKCSQFLAMSIDKIIEVLRTHKYHNTSCNNCLKYHSALWKSTFNCKVWSRFHNTLIHFIVQKIKTSDPDIALFLKEDLASSGITQSSN